MPRKLKKSRQGGAVRSYGQGRNRRDAGPGVEPLLTMTNGELDMEFAIAIAVIVALAAAIALGIGLAQQSIKIAELAAKIDDEK